MNNPQKSNHCYCSVRGFYLRTTEKAILLLKNHKPHWLPFSLLFINDPLVEKSIVTIDIPCWLATEHDLERSYQPVTNEGKKHNEGLGLADFGLPQPSLEDYLLQQQAESSRRGQLMKHVQITESQRELLRSFKPQEQKPKRMKTQTAVAEQRRALKAMGLITGG